jgi:HK97 gp10 family phage protein
MAKVEGLAQLQRRLARLPPKIKAEVKPAIDKGADALVAMQKRLAPVDEGNLRDSIRKEDGRHELAVVVKAGAGIPYETFVEFGTVNMPAQPFFWPAYRASRRSIRSRISRAVKKAVRSNV